MGEPDSTFTARVEEEAMGSREAVTVLVAVTAAASAVKAYRAIVRSENFMVVSRRVATSLQELPGLHIYY